MNQLQVKHQPINSQNLKISQAKVEINQPLSVGTYDVKVLVTGDIVQEIHGDDNDGGVSITYVLKASSAEVQE